MECASRPAAGVIPVPFLGFLTAPCAVEVECTLCGYAFCSLTAPCAVEVECASGSAVSSHRSRPSPPHLRNGLLATRALLRGLDARASWPTTKGMEIRW